MRFSKKFLFIPFSISVIISAFLIRMILIEPYSLSLNKIQIPSRNFSNNLKNLKIIFFADLHYGYGAIDDSKLSQIVSIINAQNPDLILIGGDLVYGYVKNNKRPSIEILSNYLGNLKAKYAVITVLGNHDWCYGGRIIEKSLSQKNIIVLENNNVKLNINGEPLYIAGLADFATRFISPTKTFEHIPQNAPCIFLTHNPEGFEFAQNNIELTLAGHTHGGQVSLPLFNPSYKFLKTKYNKGLIKEGDMYMFISCGIGTTLFPIRLFNQPEIVLIELI